MKHWLFQRAGTDSPNRKIFRAAVVVGLAIFATKIVTTLKELVVARWFGRGDDLDAFLIAFLLPSFVLSVVVGAITSVLVPAFVDARQNDGPEAAQRLFSSVTLLSLLLLAAIAVLLAIFAPSYLPYLGSSFSPAKLHLTRQLLYVLVPFIVFNGILTCAAAVLNAGERFAVPALAPLLTPVLTILLIEIGVGRWGAFTLAGGVVGGSFLEAALVVRALRVYGMRLSLRWYGLTPDLRAVLGQYAPMMAATFLGGGTSVVDQSMAAMLQPGSVAALNYANKVATVVTSIGVTGLGTAILPYFSKMVACNDWNGCRHTLKKYSAVVFTASLPVTLILVFFAKPIVRLLFQRGAFTSADTQLVSWVEICYAFQVPFAICGMLFVRFLSALRLNRVLMYSSAVNLLLDIILNVILVRVMGVAGIALATSIVYIVSFLFLSAWSMRFLAKKPRLTSAAVAVPEAEIVR
jgi:putative peptidoglycan lipid II flippase